MPVTRCRDDHIYLIEVREQMVSAGRTRIVFSTNRGDMIAHCRLENGTRKAVILLGDDFDARFDRQFQSVDDALVALGIGSGRVEYRVTGDCAQCAIDALLLCQYLDDEGVTDVVLAGWSFGGAVALAAGSICRTARGVAAISPTDISQCCLRWMADKPTLLMFSEDDRKRRTDNLLKIAARSNPHSTRTIIYSQVMSGKAAADLVCWISEAFLS